MVKSPRFLRPHKVVFLNRIGEVNNVEMTSPVMVNHVKVEKKRTKNYGITGGSIADEVLVVIDMNDYESDKVYVDNEVKFTDPGKQFMIRVGDYVIYDGEQFEIYNVLPVSPLRSAPEFLEVRAR